MMEALLKKIKGEKSKDCMPELTGMLNWSRTQTHIWHLQTDNEALHKALNMYYDSAVGFIDRLSEVYLGHYSDKKATFKFEMPDVEFKDLSGVEDVKNHLTEVAKEVDMARTHYKDKPSLINILDDIDEFLNKMLYLITLQ